MEKKKVTVRQWFVFILVGLVGQLAWALENNELNPWVYSQTLDVRYITWMTIASAIAATLTTFFMGALSDRVGRRKVFITVGSIIWGVSVFAFAFFSFDNMAAQFGEARAPLMVGIFMTLMDCVMTFFGSTSNDACFNAYVTDNTNEDNRGKVESILSILPLFANILILVLMMIFKAGSIPDGASSAAATAKENGEATAQAWFWFFLVVGIVVFVMGIVSIWLIPKEDAKPNKNGHYWQDVIYGFRPSVVKSHKNLYIALLAFMAFNCAMDAFMPYWLVYFQNGISQGGLGLSGMSFYIPVIVIMLAASIGVVIVGLFMDKIGKLKLLLPALGLGMLGFLLMFFSTQVWSLTISGVLMMGGYLIGTAVLGATVRDETPLDKVGSFQGVRMVFAVLLPMIIGSYVSLAVFRLQNNSYIDRSTQQSTTAPSKYMFLVALGFILLAVIPAVWLLIAKKKSPKALPSDEKQ
jgi:MFS family permease